jgi:predicted metal-dependent hydrolase
VRVCSGSYIDMRVRPGTSPDRRRLLLREWYREQLRELIPPLIDKWEPVLNVRVSSWGIKRMKTKWGSCNATAKRIWLNLELAKKPVECLEYVVVHEMVHLLERHHNDRFIALMDDCLPQWRTYRDELNTAPLAHESWER